MAVELMPQRQTLGSQDIEYVLSQNPRLTQTQHEPFFIPPPIIIFSGGQTYDKIQMKGTSVSTPKEEIPLEQIRSDVSNLRADVSEIKADLRYIRESLSPIPEMSKDIAVLKNEATHINRNFDGLVIWVRGIGIGFILLLIGYFINNILPMLSSLPQQ